MTQPYKIVVIGEQSTGKSCLLTRLTHEKFDDLSSASMTASVIIIKDYPIDDKTQIELTLWDLPGNPRYETINRLHIRKSDAVLLCIEPSAINHPNNITQQINNVRALNLNAPITLVITKSDLPVDASLTARLIAYAKEHALTITTTSAKTGDNVTQLFEQVARQCAGHAPKEVISSPPLLELKKKIDALADNNNDQKALKNALIRLHKELIKQEKKDAITSDAIAKATLTLLENTALSNKSIDSVYSSHSFYINNYQEQCAPYFPKKPVLARLIGIVIITSLCAGLGLVLGMGLGLALSLPVSVLLYSTIACSATVTGSSGALISSMAFFKPNPVNAAIKQLTRTCHDESVNTINKVP